MIAVPATAPRLEVMTEADLDDVIAIENEVYTHPWSRGNFADSLRASYLCRTWREGARLIGYFVLLSAADEAHLLNLSVAAPAQRRGHGSALLNEVLRMAREAGSRKIFLEVRPSNAAGLGLYARFGFAQVGRRRDYYPAVKGREDAFVLARTP